MFYNLYLVNNCLELEAKLNENKLCELGAMPYIEKPARKNGLLCMNKTKI